MRLSTTARFARIVLEQARERGETLDVSDLAETLEVSDRHARRIAAELRAAGVDAIRDGRR